MKKVPEAVRNSQVTSLDPRPSIGPSTSNPES